MKVFLTNNKQQNSKIFSKGFTLIELLVVISIIGLLSSTVLASLNSARAKARDARRKADLKQIETALQFYYDSYGVYPPHRPSNSCGGFRADWATSFCSESNWLTTDDNFLAILNSMPRDPVNELEPGFDDTPWWFSLTFTYGVSADGQQYDLLTNLENTSDSDRCELKLWRSQAVWPLDTGCYSGALYGAVPERAKQIWAVK